MTNTYYRGKIILYSRKEAKLLPGHQSGPLRIKTITKSEIPIGVFTPGSDERQSLFFWPEQNENRNIRVQRPWITVPVLTGN